MMNGKCVYFAIAALLGILGALIHFFPFFLIILMYLYALRIFKSFKKTQLIILFLTASIFFIKGQEAETKNKTMIPENISDFSLEFIEDPKIDGDLLQIAAKETRFKEKLLIRYEIKSEEEQASLKNRNFYGCHCRVSGTMKKPRIAKNPNGFDYRAYLSDKGIYWIVESGSNPLQDCSLANQSNPLVLLKKLRFSGGRYLEEHFPPEIASLSAALIFGDRRMLDQDLLREYQETGIVHLLAISGLHVSLLAGMIFHLGIRSGVTRESMVNFLLLALPVYVILTGAAPSVIRAALMIFLVLLTVKWKSRLKLLPFDAISIAFILYIFILPYIIFDAGFQLSFAVSFAIILSANKILRGTQGNGLKMFAASIISQLTALPLLLFHFFEMSLTALAANLFYIPLFSFVYLPGLYLLFFMQILTGTTPAILIELFVKIIQFSNKLIGVLADLPFTSFVPGRPSLVLIVIYLLIIPAIFIIWESKKSAKWKTHLVLLFFILFTVQPAWNFINPYGEVTMIDVGQGDSILIHLPHGKGNYLIDTGGTMQFTEEKWRQRSKPFEVGRDVVVPYLKGKGITRIDMLILTHGDMDHIGGAFSILEEITVKQILMPSVKEPSDTELAILQEAEKKGIQVIKICEGTSWKKGSHEFTVLSPEQNFTGERNSGSAAIYAKIGGISWFFGGDLDIEGEEKIMKKYPNLRVDVFKAGHHGSKTSNGEEFLKQIQAQVVLISAGENNRYGHPHQEVLERLSEIHPIIYRTDQHGAITCRFFRGKGTFLPFLP